MDNFFKTFNVKRIDEMFYYCEKLKSIDLSNLYTPFLERMSDAFAYCNSLEFLELPNLNTSNKNISDEDFSKIFTYSSGIKYINLLNYAPKIAENGTIFLL